MKFLLIDGNNIGVRAAFANKDLRADFTDYSQDINPDSTIGSSSDMPTGAIHGFFRTLNAVMRAYPDRFVVVTWDGKSKSRVLASRKAVEKGIIPQEYKGNRTSDQRPQQVIDFHVQRPIIMDALSKTNIPQIAKNDEEADDIIASCVSCLKGQDILILTNDRDYYQLLDASSILNSDGHVLNENWYRASFGISPAQWVDVGALMGDDGDNIFGLPWWGKTTAIREIAKHGTCEAVINHFISTYGHLRDKFPDIKGDEFDVLRNLKTADEKPRMPHIKEWMPFTGVALAYEQGKVKLPRNALMALVYQDRVPLAKQLKKMRSFIKMPQLPVDLKRDCRHEFVSICEKYGLREIASHSDKLCCRQVIA